MSKKVLKPIQKTFIRQQDQQDCGVACLLSVIRFYGGNASLERLRELSGTHSQGTTMLDLVQACPIIGLEAKGLQTDVNFLKNTQKPLILHVLIDKKLPHYVVCYSFDAQKQKFCIGALPRASFFFLKRNY